MLRGYWIFRPMLFAQPDGWAGQMWSYPRNVFLSDPAVRRGASGHRGWRMRRDVSQTVGGLPSRAGSRSVYDGGPPGALVGRAAALPIISVPTSAAPSERPPHGGLRTGNASPGALTARAGAERDTALRLHLEVSIQRQPQCARPPASRCSRCGDIRVKPQLYPTSAPVPPPSQTGFGRHSGRQHPIRGKNTRCLKALDQPR